MVIRLIIKWKLKKCSMGRNGVWDQTTLTTTDTAFRSTKTWQLETSSSGLTPYLIILSQKDSEENIK